jgi:hypothetical protein
VTTPTAELAKLVRYFDASGEAPTLPILQELERLGSVRAASALARSQDPQERLLAARLMELVPDESYVPALAALVRDADPAVAGAAREAFAGQRHTEEWRALAARLGEA